ncbi:hypothetical protein SPRG_11217 [Saprolegnia parasitica CBS 223.65]|uniref:Uncharacterized protein n=1 Tax=Saprolegnia parasitica (strain CBS 223.65) TaxID=695850 RepID=A0A067CAF6_SAPPC|nr:hypothetical protein SPRG_11217 [Saprolegnia parasitica CBS 223.65]KDO23787.1 hypothetical protein SPRG_11217 [Saprolegnia parasitica CBS 223.65]|eukprot:XP_012205425.1 hypothetical protein SPRG_11217 [Saprolegnia parasitica CBS 223.65]
MDANLMESERLKASSEPSVGRRVLTGVTVLATGLVFGFAMNKAQVYLPFVIMDQMAFQRFTMMKLFMAALGTSLISKAIFRVSQPSEFEKMQAARASDPSTSTVLVVGATILGAGMTISGSCPGTVYVQLGAQIASAPACFGGTILGTLLAMILRAPIAKWEMTRSKIASTLPVSALLQTLLGCGCVGFSVALEFILREPIAPSAWYPCIAGAVVGALQLPLAFLVRKSLGVSAAMKYILGEAVAGLSHVAGNPSWLSLPRSSAALQVLFALGIVGGSLISGTPLEAAGPMPSTLPSIIGGAMIAFGASTACGCTSGHGFSGTAMLMASSWLVVPFIFAGGMGTAGIKYLLGL